MSSQPAEENEMSTREIQDRQRLDQVLAQIRDMDAAVTHRPVRVAQPSGRLAHPPGI